MANKQNSNVMFLLRLPEDLKWKVEELAAKNRKRSVTAYIQDILQREVEKEKAAVGV